MKLLEIDLQEVCQISFLRFQTFFSAVHPFSPLSKYVHKQPKYRWRLRCRYRYRQRLLPSPDMMAAVVAVVVAA